MRAEVRLDGASERGRNEPSSRLSGFLDLGDDRFGQLDGVVRPSRRNEAYCKMFTRARDQ